MKGVTGSKHSAVHGKNGFVTATKLGTTDTFFVAAIKNFAAAAKRSVDRTKHFDVAKCFCYPYFKKWFCLYNKTFFPVRNVEHAFTYFVCFVFLIILGRISGYRNCHSS